MSRRTTTITWMMECWHLTATKLHQAKLVVVVEFSQQAKKPQLPLSSQIRNHFIRSSKVTLYINYHMITNAHFSFETSHPLDKWWVAIIFAVFFSSHLASWAFANESDHPKQGIPVLTFKYQDKRCSARWFTVYKKLAPCWSEWAWYIPIAKQWPWVHHHCSLFWIDFWQHIPLHCLNSAPLSYFPFLHRYKLPCFFDCIYVCAGILMVTLVIAASFSLCRRGWLYDHWRLLLSLLSLLQLLSLLLLLVPLPYTSSLISHIHYFLLIVSKNNGLSNESTQTN